MQEPPHFKSFHFYPLHPLHFLAPVGHSNVFHVFKYVYPLVKLHTLYLQVITTVIRYYLRILDQKEFGKVQ